MMYDMTVITSTEVRSTKQGHIIHHTFESALAE